MITGTIYEEATGRIEGTISSSDVAGLYAQQTRPGIAVCFGEFNAQSQYISQGEVLDRPKMGLVKGENTLFCGEDFVVSGIPAGTRVIYPGGEAIVDDGQIEWTSEEPGQHTLYFVNFPYQEETLNAAFADAPQPV